MTFNIPLKTSRGIQPLPIETVNFNDRIIYVEGEVNEESSTDFLKKIITLNKLDDSKPIKVLITSPGGSIDHGLLMYDAIITSKAPVETYCMGTAYSMGAILLVAGKKRYIMENSKVMLHEPLIQGGAGGSATSIKSLSDSLQRTKNKINDILIKHTNKTKKQMEKATSYDHFFSAKEAIDFGLCDEIVGINKIIESEDIKNV